MQADPKDKAEAILEAIRTSEVGGNIIIHNYDQSIWCILKLVCREHEENENGKHKETKA